MTRDASGRIWRRPPVSALGLVCLPLMLTACASPLPHLWPPGPEESSRTVFVSLDAWHAVIAFPHKAMAGIDSPPAGGWLVAGPTLEHPGGGGAFEEWGYAERGWYLEGRTGLTGVVRALLWPTEGVSVSLWHASRTDDRPETVRPSPLRNEWLELATEP